LWHANAGTQQSLDDTDGGQIVDGHYSARPRSQLRNGGSCGKPTLELQVARQDGTSFKPQLQHAFFVGLQADDVGFQLRPSSNEGNAAMSATVKIADDLLDSGKVIDPQVAHVLPHR